MVAGRGCVTSSRAASGHVPLNGDWKFKEGAYTHQLGPDRKEVALNFRVYLAGPEPDARKLGAGDYVLTGRPEYSSWNCPVTG